MTPLPCYPGAGHLGHRAARGLVALPDAGLALLLAGHEDFARNPQQEKKAAGGNRGGEGAGGGSGKEPLGPLFLTLEVAQVRSVMVVRCGASDTDVRG